MGMNSFLESIKNLGSNLDPHKFQPIDPIIYFLFILKILIIYLFYL